MLHESHIKQSIRRGVLECALGSAHLQSSSECVTVGIFGPTHLCAGDARKQAKLNVCFKMDGELGVGSGGLAMHSSRAKFSPDVCEALESFIHESLQSVIIYDDLGLLQYDVTIFCHFSAGPMFLLDTVVSACCMAFLDAGIPMRDIFACTSIILRGQDDRNFVTKNDSRMFGTLSVASTTLSKEIISFSLKGNSWRSLPLKHIGGKKGKRYCCSSESSIFFIKSLQDAVSICLSENSIKRKFLVGQGA